MKTLGCKVSVELFDRFCSLKGNVSENLRNAVKLYIDRELTKVNRKTMEDEYQTILYRDIEYIHCFIDDLEG